MRIPTFTFKHEAIWILVLSFVPAVIGVLMFMVILLVRLSF
jgi:hypothetical protein